MGYTMKVGLHDKGRNVLLYEKNRLYESESGNNHFDRIDFHFATFFFHSARRFSYEPDGRFTMGEQDTRALRRTILDTDGRYPHSRAEGRGMLDYFSILNSIRLRDFLLYENDKVCSTATK